MEKLLNKHLRDLTVSELVRILKHLNKGFRSGKTLLSDTFYDIYSLRLRLLDPNNKYLKKVEPEVLNKLASDRLPSRMLSTDKAYTIGELEKWYNRGILTALRLGMDSASVVVRATPKLDGFALYKSGYELYTRGDGVIGVDRSNAYTVINFPDDCRDGPGELVIDSKYFADNLADKYSNSRNFQSTVIKPGKPNEDVLKAYAAKAIVFKPFYNLESTIGNFGSLISQWEDNVKALRDNCPFDTDGIVLEFIDDDIKELLGDTKTFHRWQIAFKENTQMVAVTADDVICQISRTGRANPVAVFDPFTLGDVVVTRATAHNYGMVRDRGIGPGADLMITRAGDVIPTILDVLNPSKPKIPTNCPCCNSTLVWEKDFLMCKNLNGCKDIAVARMVFFFDNLNNCDGFGPSTLAKLYDNGINTVDKVYDLTLGTLEVSGFSPKESQNLIDALTTSKTVPVELSKWLASFGISGLGNSNSEELLLHVDIPTLMTLTSDVLMGTDGIGKLTADKIVAGLKLNGDLILCMLDKGFNFLQVAKVVPNADKLNFVLTGSFDISRTQIKKLLKAAGHKVTGSISSKTDILLMGDNPGNNKSLEAIQYEVTIKKDYKEYV